MRSIPVIEAKAHFSALLAEVEAGGQIAITRHGRSVARLLPPSAQTAADVLRPLWEEGGGKFDLTPPKDVPP